MHYLIEHRTELAFPSAVREHVCELRVLPRNNGQRLGEWSIDFDPAAEARTYEDAFGNTVHWFGIVEPHESLVTTLRARVETTLSNPFAYDPVEPLREADWLDEAKWREPRLWDFVLHRSAATPDLDHTEFPLPFPERASGAPLLESVQAAVAWIREHFDYAPGVTHVHSSLAETLAARSGVCQDFAHLLVAIVRRWGVPARYAAGYAEPEDDGAPEPGAGATHAWAQVLIPGAGWRGFDATNGLVVNDTYVTAAVGRDYQDAAPQRGSFKGEDPGTPPDVSVRVVRED